MDYMLSEIKEQPWVVKKTLTENKAVLEKIAVQLAQKQVKTLFIVARGTSDHVGIYLKYLTEYFLGIPVSLAASSIINLYQQPMQLTEAVTLAISQSGMGPDIVNVIRSANTAGGMTIGITNEPESTLAEVANYILLCQAGKELSVAATKTCTTSMAIGAALIEFWSGKEGYLQEIPELIAKMLTYFDKIGNNLKPFLQAEGCLVLARGFNYSIALETALKIQETSYLNARGFSTADFQHGPLALLEQNLPIILYAFKGPALKGIVELLGLLRQSKTYIFLVTNDQTLINMADDYLLLPETLPEVITPFATVVFGQIFAYHLARAKGLDPNQPRNLKKVTQTL